jgi:hypothetical protein
MTIRLKSSRFSPALNRYVRHIARVHCNPAKTELASVAFKSRVVMSIKSGHFAGKSYWRIFCSIGIICTRTCGGEEARIGSSRARNASFSSSDIGFCIGPSSTEAQPLLTLFLRYTTAIHTQSVSPISAKWRLWNVLDTLIPLSCSASRMSRSTLRNPGCPSACSPKVRG